MSATGENVVPRPTEPVDPNDVDEELTQDEDIWNEFSRQEDGTSPVSKPAPEPEEAAEPSPEPPPAAAAESPEETPEPTPEPEAAATEPPPAEPQPEAAPPAAEPEVPASVEPPPQLAATAQAQPEPQLTDEQRAQRIKDLRKAALDEAERYYALPEDMGEELLQSPGKVLPALAAQVQMTTQEVVINEVMRLLPMAVSAELERRQHAETFWNEFYGEWPKLKGRTADVERMAATYQQMNPQADRAKLIRDVGASAMIAMRVPMEAPAKPAPAPSAPPPPPPPPSTGSRPASPAPKLGMYEQLSVEWEDEDDR